MSGAKDIRNLECNNKYAVTSQMQHVSRNQRCCPVEVPDQQRHSVAYLLFIIYLFLLRLIIIIII